MSALEGVPRHRFVVDVADSGGRASARAYLAGALGDDPAFTLEGRAPLDPALHAELEPDGTYGGARDAGSLEP